MDLASYHAMVRCYDSFEPYSAVVFGGYRIPYLRRTAKVLFERLIALGKP
ncbi:MAG: hypothetical protein ACI9J0_004210 [Cryomorphaceae bacterium]|jgi:hypothetical protein